MTQRPSHLRLLSVCLAIASGDEVTIGTLITSNPARLEGAGVKPDDVDPALRTIADQVKDRGPGGHFLTGPIFAERAEPGDVLEVRIIPLDAKKMTARFAPVSASRCARSSAASARPRRRHVAA